MDTDSAGLNDGFVLSSVAVDTISILLQNSEWFPQNICHR